MSEYKVSVLKQALINCLWKQNEDLTEMNEELMKFEVDSKVLEKLKKKAEREGVQLQTLLEKFADS